MTMANVPNRRFGAARERVMVSIDDQRCWVVAPLRFTGDGVWTVIIVPHRIVRFERRTVTTWHAPGHTMEQLEEIADACWRLPPGRPTVESLEQRHLDPLFAGGHLTAIDMLRLLAPV